MPGMVVIVASAFGAVFIIGLLVTMVKVAAARDIAARRGDDPGEAALITLLGGNVGLAATYLRGGQLDVTERLAELEELRRKQLITDEEAARRRAEIIAGI